MCNNAIGVLTLKDEVYGTGGKEYFFYDDFRGYEIINDDGDTIRVSKDDINYIKYNDGTMFVSPFTDMYNDLDILLFSKDERYRVISELDFYYVLMSEDDATISVIKREMRIVEIVGFDFEEYQKQTAKTAVFPADNALEYLSFGLIGEAGELANKFKKIYRDDNGKLTDERLDAIKLEIGDILWYISELSTFLKFDLSQIALDNLTKLRVRQSKNALHGDGDNR